MSRKIKKININETQSKLYSTGPKLKSNRDTKSYPVQQGSFLHAHAKKTPFAASLRSTAIAPNIHHFTCEQKLSGVYNVNNPQIEDANAEICCYCAWKYKLLSDKDCDRSPTKAFSNS